MIIEFLGADHEVTGSCHYLSVGEHHILIDCGMQQGPDTYENQEIPVNASNIDFVFVTHAHIDHSGLLPLLYARGFRGKIYATEATTMLCDIMLRDSAHIQEQEAEWKNRKGKRSGRHDAVTPLYEMNDALGVMKLFYSVHYEEKIEVSEDISARFIDAGHLLGSASIELWLRENGEEKKVVFSGDIGNSRKPLIKEPKYINEADYVIMEATYGDRDHENPGDFAERLAAITQETLDRGGNLVIPAFSVGRTQEMLYFFRRIKEEGLVKGINADFDVYMDSPLAVEATSIFKKNVSECFDEEAARIVQSGRNPIGFPGLRTAVTSDESKLINFDMKPKVIISASGMCEAGRIRHHLKHNLWRPESTIVFVGFQVPGTLGYSLLNGAKEVRLFGETVAVEAHIENLPGISGHADHRGLLSWIEAFGDTPKKVFVVHGQNLTVDIFAKELREEKGLDAYAPFSGDAFDLLTGAKVKEGSRVQKAPYKPDVKPASNVFLRLLAAGQRLLKVIERCEGMANKDLAKFADQINALSDKWDR
ncbi:MAG: MBL fold metallo-hydrolase [Lachnospiraceae bacterium]|nr:MBL fold metallo-hydrolase [Lachnospiraceae bacterium]